MTAAILGLMLQLALYGFEVNLGEMGKGVVWMRYGSTCWFVDVSRYAEGPKLPAWDSAYDAIYMTQMYHIAKGNVKPPDPTRKAFCEAKVGVDTSLMIAPVVPPIITLITAPTGTLVNGADTWTFGSATSTGGNAILLNGVATGGFGKSLQLTNGKVYTFTAESKWYVWNGNWAATVAP